MAMRTDTRWVLYSPQIFAGDSAHGKSLGKFLTALLRLRVLQGVGVAHGATPSGSTLGAGSPLGDTLSATQHELHLLGGHLLGGLFLRGQ